MLTCVIIGTNADINNQMTTQTMDKRAILHFIKKWN